MVNKVEQGDQIQSITILGDFDAFLESVEEVAEWNSTLDDES